MRSSTGFTCAWGLDAGPDSPIAIMAASNFVTRRRAVGHGSQKEAMALCPIFMRSFMTSVTS